VDEVLGVDELPDIEYTDDMALTHADFLRLVPSAMGDHMHRSNFIFRVSLKPNKRHLKPILICDSSAVAASLAVASQRDMN